MATQPNWKPKTIWTGDNLEIMRGMNSESVDLIYLDPPFNSKTNYAAPIGSKAAGAEFKDTWTLSDVDAEWINLIEEKHPLLQRVLLAGMTNSDKSYLMYMAVRLLEMYRILKPDGSIYLHCDSTMSHPLKMVMDAIFGGEKFRNDIAWQRSPSKNDGTLQQFGKVSDHILLYSGSSINRDAVKIPLEHEYLVTSYRYEDDRGRWRSSDLTGPGVSKGEAGKSWKGFDPSGIGRCWSAPKTGDYVKWIDGQIPGYLNEASILKRLDMLDEAGLIHWSSKGVPNLKRYLIEGQGQVPGDIWTDIQALGARAKERLGYPTQKPVALLERIINASSKEGDMVFDPFCGCATTLAAADRLQRNWVGIDISPKAAELVRQRIEDQQGLFREIIARDSIPERTDLGDLPSPRTQLDKLYGKQGGYCAGCKTHFKKQHLEVDHIIAKSKGGTDHIDNLQLLCGNCNRVKGDRGMDYLQTKLQIT